MEIRTVAFESNLIITLQDNQKVIITPFKTPEPGNFKLGIDAPFGIAVNREEIYKRKQVQQQLDPQDTINYTLKIPALFTELLSITHKSEKLEVAAKNIFDKIKILTPKTLEKIACGEITTSKWIVTCAIDVLITDKPKSIKKLFSADELFFLWARSLLNRTTDNTSILNKARLIDIPILTEKISSYSML